MLEQKNIFSFYMKFLTVHMQLPLLRVVCMMRSILFSVCQFRLLSFNFRNMNFLFLALIDCVNRSKLLLNIFPMADLTKVTS